MIEVKDCFDEQIDEKDFVQRSTGAKDFVDIDPGNNPEEMTQHLVTDLREKGRRAHIQGSFLASSSLVREIRTEERALYKAKSDADPVRSSIHPTRCRRRRSAHECWSD